MAHLAEATRPCEILCFLPVEFPVSQDTAYCYLTMDVYSQFLIQTGLEYSNHITYVLKHMELLMQHADFVNRKQREFTIVLHKHEEHRAQIEAIIGPHGGSLVIDEPYLYDRMVPAIESLFKRMAK